MPSAIIQIQISVEGLQEEMVPRSNTSSNARRSYFSF